ncbi:MULTISPECIES: DUF4345 family protein [unclassified Yoonia]|uniref:DUF4345 family protein n=1 Tax=unclassified Yoonia TaxID=2629118 RepID=UPI002B003521|nr:MULTISPECIES: DUF4345 family protein [unclassified Yoonia]
MDIINYIFVLASIGLGVFGWLAPRYTLETLDLQAGPTNMGPSEIRASAGALFIGMGLGALILGSPAAYAMLGFCWLGASVGRATSLVLDGQSRKKWTFFGVEAVVGLGALALNLPLAM